MNRILEKSFRLKWRNPPLKNNKNGIVGGGAIDVDATQERQNKNLRHLGSDTKCPREKNETFRLGHQMSQKRESEKGGEIANEWNTEKIGRVELA